MGRLLFVPDSAPVQETGNLKVFADDDYAPPGGREFLGDRNHFGIEIDGGSHARGLAGYPPAAGSRQFSQKPRGRNDFLREAEPLNDIHAGRWIAFCKSLCLRLFIFRADRQILLILRNAHGSFPR